MTRLALTLPLHRNETPPSFVSRLSRRNLTIPRELCSDQGMRWPHACSSHADQLERLAEISGADLRELKASGAILIAQSRYQVGMSQATTGTFRRAITRICPQCILEAIECNGRFGAFQRLEWLVLCLGVCRKHHVPLLQLPNANYTHVTYDVVGQVEKFKNRVLEAADRTLIFAPTRFEEYFCARILEGPRGDWLDPLDLTDLHRGALTLGMTLNGDASRLVSSLDWHEGREAMATGFELLARGPNALVNTLETLRVNYRTERPYFSKDLGPFYSWLKAGKNNPNLNTIRRHVESFVLEKYPLQVGKSVLGSQMIRPKYLTLNRVRKEYGLGHVRVRGILAHLKGIDVTELHRAKDISHVDLERVVAYWNTLQDLKSAAAQLNVQPIQVKSLIEREVLEARSFGTSLRYIKSASVQRLLRKLDSLPDGRPTRLNLPLKIYCRAEKVPLAQVISDWSAGRLCQVSRDKSLSGLQGILVERGEVFQPSHICLSGDLTLTEAATYLRISVISIRKLRDGGFLERCIRVNPDTNFRKSYITKNSIMEFEARYQTLGQIAHAIRQAPIHVARALDNLQVEPIECRAGYVRVYPIGTTDLIANRKRRETR